MPTERFAPMEAESLLSGLLALNAEVGPRVSLGSLITFLTIATDYGTLGVTADELARQIGVSQPGMHRILGDLGMKNRYGEQGLGLIDAVPDPNEPRRMLWFLTERGKHRVAQLLSPIFGTVDQYPGRTARDAAATLEKEARLRNEQPRPVKRRTKAQ